MAPIPITIVTGFLGSGKTTLILNLIPQLPQSYKLALLKNEFGDLAVDSQLAASSAISGVKELLNGCICCNLVGQLGDALETLRSDVKPDRIIIETSGSAFPATLAMEINRLARDSGHYVLDGVVTVIDVENWKGYEDTSYTAKLQAKYTDLVVFNKWEQVSERRYEDCLDRVGDLELQVANVKSDRGRVDHQVLLGLDSVLARTMISTNGNVAHEHSREHSSDHQDEVEVLSIALACPPNEMQGVDLESLETFLLQAPKDEIYRIKAIITASRPPAASDGNEASFENRQMASMGQYILNWAFGRWTFTPVRDVAPLPSPPNSIKSGSTGHSPEFVLKMTVILARGEAEKWRKRVEAGDLLELEGDNSKVSRQVVRVV
ncbi:hypothetical protein MMC20_004649 [Loxospora ochrophaea]|nr:hypothetical protein [Loxospora ochrophaea]